MGMEGVREEGRREWGIGGVLQSCVRGRGMECVPGCGPRRGD